MEINMQQEDEQESMTPIKALYRKYWVDNRERIMEIYRIYFHTIFVSILMVVNVVTAYSATIIYFAQWNHKEGSIESFLTLFFPYPPHFMTGILSIPFVELDTHLVSWFLVFLNLPLLTWLYSTITQPIKRGYKTYIDWRSRKGRIFSALLNGVSLVAHYCAIFAWYVEHYMFDFFNGIRSDAPYLVVKSMASFGYLLMCVPVFICLTGGYLLMKQFHMNEDLRKMFFKWEFGLLASQSFSLRSNRADVIIGWEKATNKPIVLVESARFLHELVNGATGTGKTSTTILIRIVQDLIRIARGKKIGICVLEPKGDLIRDVLKLCDKLGIPKSKIKVVDPTDLIHSTKFNPFIGPMEVAAETFRGVLDALAGDQDEFFKGQQSETAALYTMLGKIRHGNLFSIVHMQRMYSDPRYLANMTEEVRSWITKNLENSSLSQETQVLLDRYERVCSYFENEVIEYKTYRDKEQRIMPVLYPDGHKYEGLQVVDNKKDKFITGAKKYVNDICMNAMLSQLMIANEGEEVLDIDKFLAEGGVLLVNTALGELEELSMSFGQFFIRQFQSSVFRRPPEDSFFKRIPIFFTIDEFPLYINEAFVRLLTLGRTYLVGTLIAIQSLGQLESVVRGYERTIMSNASNKTVFGRGEVTDDELFSKLFGEEPEVEESLNESVTPISMPNPTVGYRYNTARQLTPRFTPTEIREQEFKNFIVQMVGEDGSLQVPVQAYGKFIDETKFLKRFIKIGEAELETSKYKSLGSPMKWIQKLAIDTADKIKPLDILDKKQEKVESTELEETTEEQKETSDLIEEEIVTPMKSPQNNALPIRTEEATEVVKIDYSKVEEPPIKVDLVKEQTDEAKDSEKWIIEMPAPPDPSEALEQKEADFFFYEGLNPESINSNSYKETVLKDDIVEYSEPDKETGSAIEELVREVSGETSFVNNNQIAVKENQKAMEEWSILDLVASDVELPVSGESHEDPLFTAQDIQTTDDTTRESASFQSTSAKSQEQTIAISKVNNLLDVETDDL
ncbi:type IV secretory system conjugative DNA transfer family protein [Paenibacillus polymyxa]|uniref:type IV secretory system conjugative DNA transfer family protein n=1 Tax=Paenibacillus polymyxa TaxID=1406 RepID=UPI0025B725A3|nr:type IV secretory system conjugative DNA transfer family protein [Paenibacillus polymyxa]MDN4106206.1 TraM recognition domain-containing protein [Paenibacillus polymyxa]